MKLPHTMTYDAIVFRLAMPFDGPASIGLLCVECRYVSAVWNGSDRIYRCFATGAAWKDVSHQVSVGLPPGPLNPGSALVRLFHVPDEPTPPAPQVQWVRTVRVTVERPEDAAGKIGRATAGAGAGNQSGSVCRLTPSRSARYIDIMRTVFPVIATCDGGSELARPDFFGTAFAVANHD